MEFKFVDEASLAVIGHIVGRTPIWYSTELQDVTDFGSNSATYLVQTFKVYIGCFVKVSSILHAWLAKQTSWALQCRLLLY